MLETLQCHWKRLLLPLTFVVLDFCGRGNKPANFRHRRGCAKPPGHLLRCPMALLHRFTGWNEECFINLKSHEKGWEKKKQKKKAWSPEQIIHFKIFTEYIGMTIFVFDLHYKVLVVRGLKRWLLWEPARSFPTCDKANASQAQDRPTAGQGWAHQWQW